MERPTGAGQKAGGWVLMIIGAIAFLLSLDRSGVGVDSVMRQWTLLILSGSAFGLAMMLFAVGWILRAIWFLPGREIEPEAAVTSSPAEIDDTNSSRSLAYGLIGAVFVTVAVLALVSI